MKWNLQERCRRFFPYFARRATTMPPPLSLHQPKGQNDVPGIYSSRQRSKSSRAANTVIQSSESWCTTQIGAISCKYRKRTYNYRYWIYLKLYKEIILLAIRYGMLSYDIWKCARKVENCQNYQLTAGKLNSVKF